MPTASLSRERLFRPQGLAAELYNKEAVLAPRNHRAESSKRGHKLLYGIIAGLVLVLAVSMAGTFASSLVAIESAKDTVISSDGAFVDKKTGALVSTENPHITTKVFNLVQALEGLLSSETNAALPGQKGIVARERHLGAWCTPCIVAHFCDGLGRPTSEIKDAASRVGDAIQCARRGCFCGVPQQPPHWWPPSPCFTFRETTRRRLPS